MADREQSHASRREKPQRDMAGRVGQAHGGQGDLQKERERGVKPGGTVGRDVSDLKARNITPKLRWTPVARAARARRKASIRLRALFTNRSKEKSEMNKSFPDHKFGIT